MFHDGSILLQRKKAQEAEIKAEKMSREAEEKKKEVSRLKEEVCVCACMCVYNMHYHTTHTRHIQLAQSTEKHEKRFSSLTTPSIALVQEGATDDQEEGQVEGDTELDLEGVSNVGSEMDRVHIAEKNKAMAAKLKVY